MVGAFCAFRSARWRPRQARSGSPRACAQVPPIRQRHSLHIQQQTLQAHLHFSVRKRAVSPRIWDFCNKIGTFSDLVGRTDDVCSLRQTGSKRRALTIALLTLNGHRSRADCERISQIARASPTPTETTRFERRTAAAASPHFCWPTYFCV